MRSLILSVLMSFVFTLPAHAGDKAAILKDNMDMAQKLEDIAAPILINNPQLCGSYKTSYLGAEFMTTEGVDKSYRDLVAKHYGVGDYPTVTILGKGSPAAAKLKHGDSIRSVNGKVLKRGHDGQDALMEEIASGQTLNLHLVRKGQEHKTSITPATVCGAKVRLDPKDADDIYAEKGKVFVTKGALRSRGADALAGEIKSQLSRYKQ